MANPGVFSGVRVLELAQHVFVPGAGVLLADQGAEVIHVETTGAGDPFRSLKLGGGRQLGNVNLALEQNNRGKKSIALDLKSEEGREAFLKLVETADVFLTSLRPKAIRALRLDVDDVRARNPKIIYARGNGGGCKGAEADKAGYDAVSFWARGGLCYAMTIPGNKSTPPRAAFGDHSGSVSLAFAISGALYKRAATGEPSVVEASLLSTALWMLSADVTYSQHPDYETHPEGGTRSPFLNGYITRDGRQIQFTLLDPNPVWPSLCKLLELEELLDDPRFKDPQGRQQNGEALADTIAERIGERDWADWREGFEAWDAPWELNRTVHEVSEDPQALANGMVFNLDIGDQTVRLVSGPATFNGHAGPIDRKGSPKLGEHTDALLAEVGYSAEALGKLRAGKVVQ